MDLEMVLKVASSKVKLRVTSKVYNLEQWMAWEMDGKLASLLDSKKQSKDATKKHSLSKDAISAI